jgi:hypothetical protein
MKITVHEIRMKPKNKDTTVIEWLDIRVTIVHSRDALDLVERKFPDFQTVHIVSGYKDV